MINGGQIPMTSPGNARTTSPWLSARAASVAPIFSSAGYCSRVFLSATSSSAPMSGYGKYYPRCVFKVLKRSSDTFGDTSICRGIIHFERHNNHMIFRAAEGLNSLAVRAARLIDVFANGCRAHKTNRLNRRVRKK